MKKLILFATILFLGGSLAAEDYIHTTFYSDGAKKLWPHDGITVRLFMNGAQIDLDALDSVGNYRESDSMIQCTLTTTVKGPHHIYVTIKDGADYIDGWDGDYDNRNDSAAYARSVWDNDVIAQLSRTADAASISGGAAAADSLERMLDGNRATLYLSQLNIQADGNKSAIQAYASGYGNGASIQGGPTGAGIVGAGGASGGPGIKAIASVDHGFVIQGGAVSGSYDGMRIIKGGTGVAVNLMDGKIKGFIDSLSAAGIDLIWDEDTTGHYTSPNLAYAASQTSGLTGANMKAIADSVWQADTAGRNSIAGSYGKALSEPAYVQGAAAGLDSAKVYSVLTDWFNPAVGKAWNKARFSNVLILDSTDNDTAALWVKSLADHGFDINVAGSNDAFRKVTSSGVADYAYAGGNGGTAVAWGAAGTEPTWHVYNTDDGDAVHWNTVDTNSMGDVFEIVAGGADTSHNRAIHVEGGTVMHGRDDRSEHAVWIYGQNDGNGLYVTSVYGNASRYSVTYPSESSWAIYAAAPVKIVDSLVAGKIKANMTGHITGGIDTALFVDSVRFVDTLDQTVLATTSLGGVGSYAMTIHAVDTSGTPAAVSGVNVEVKDLTGTMTAYLPTNSSGYSRFLVDSGSWVIQASTRNGYIWECDTVLVVAAAKTDTLQGYNIAVGSPTAANLCRVYGYVYDISGDSIQGASVKAVLAGRNMRDTCANVTLATGFAVDTTTTSSGYWCLDLIKSKCLLPATGVSSTTYYKLIITYPDGTVILDKQINVPDSSSYRVTW